MGSTGQISGIGASPGTGRGELHVDVDEALDAMDAGRAVVLVLETSTPGDVDVMVRAAGIIGVSDGPQSHTAIVARGSGVPAVVALPGMRLGAHGVDVDGSHLPIGCEVVVDGAAGTVRWEQS